MDSPPNNATMLNKSSNLKKITENSKTVKSTITNNLHNYNDTCLQKILQFGRELFQMNSQFTIEFGENAANTKILRVNFFDYYLYLFVIAMTRWSPLCFFLIIFILKMDFTWT